MLADPILTTVFAWVLAIVFAGSATANFIGPKPLRDAFARWGYPSYWHLVTGALELAAAVLLAIPQTRLLGVVLGAAITLAAFATVTWHREYAHTPPSIALLTALTGLAALSAAAG
jgi:uncharacterized membrane protein YphA (DoxX/SURF4 family)